MKKILLVVALFAITFTAVLGNDPKGTIFTRPWSVSSYGFIIFPNSDDLETFVSFAKTKTHAQMQQYISDSLNGFSSLGSSIYSNSDVTVTDLEARNYALNTYRIIQSDGLIMRPISPRECSVTHEFVLVMMPTYLTSTTYGYLQSGTYNSSSMNKFATNPYTEGTALVTYCGLTPYGHEETTPSNCPGGELPAANRPFWGYADPSCNLDHTETDPVTGNPRNVYYRCDKGAYYIFWIKVKDAVCQMAYSCTGE